MVLCNKGVIERPNRLIMESKSVKVDMHAESNVEMAMIEYVASPNVNKTVGPDIEIIKGNGQDARNGESGEKDSQNVGPGSQELVGR